jgi:phage tail protein X
MAVIAILAALLFLALLSPQGQSLMDRSKALLGITHTSLSSFDITQQTSTPLQKQAPEGAISKGLPRVTIQGQSGDAQAVPPGIGDQKKGRGITVVVGPGDTVAKLAAKHYGRIDSVILDIVRKANSNLGNIDLIYEGQKIYLPSLTDTTRVMFTVSVASYHSINEATAVFLDLVKKGFQATIYPHLDSQGNTWYRITIGTFKTQDKAEESTRQLKDQGFLYAKSVKVSVEE